MRSLVFLGDMQMKQVTGNSTQIMTPIVEPTKPKTNSMFGINTPITKEINTIINVKALNFASGIKFAADPS